MVGHLVFVASAGMVDYVEVINTSLSLSMSERISCINITTLSDEVIENIEAFYIVASSNDEAVNITGFIVALVNIQDQSTGVYLQFIYRPCIAVLASDTHSIYI